ncbi:hypothetical protein [Lederbergia citrea]|uniref:Uncharacterized protein n=1 Tax=Lederbergia citrea TaxID=2833581 RepID=A0A942US96_9BACI|nr:hypothetical protein [Lederbergia citrea]MBS4223838.1 hypothetical protein [Lederbergia citrea]
MKRIQNQKELLALKEELQGGIMQYLEEEFFGLYEYLSNGEQIEDFLLMPYQSIIILDNKEELVKVVQNKIELEFMEEVNLNDRVILRIGIRRLDDIQLHYTLFECNMLEEEIP